MRAHLHIVHLRHHRHILYLHQMAYVEVKRASHARAARGASAAPEAESVEVRPEVVGTDVSRRMVFAMGIGGGTQWRWRKWCRESHSMCHQMGDVVLNQGM